MPVSGVTLKVFKPFLSSIHRFPEIGEEGWVEPTQEGFGGSLVGGNDSGQNPFLLSIFQKHVRANKEALEATPPPPPPPPPRPAPGEGRCDEGSTDSAGRPSRGAHRGSHSRYMGA